MIKHSLVGKVVLIGTPAEEGGGGKVKLLDMGAYDGLDACMMAHPGPGVPHSGAVGGSLAIQVSFSLAFPHSSRFFVVADLYLVPSLQVVKVEFFGKTAHAAGAPWE